MSSRHGPPLPLNPPTPLCLVRIRISMLLHCYYYIFFFKFTFSNLSSSISKHRFLVFFVLRCAPFLFIAFFFWIHAVSVKTSKLHARRLSVLGYRSSATWWRLCRGVLNSTRSLLRKNHLKPT